MEQFLAYGLMAVIIVVVCLVNWMKNKPVRQAADRFGLLFLEARDCALARSPALPEAKTLEDGRVRLYPPADQSPDVRGALEAGAGSAMARCDAGMEQALRDLFEAIGKSAHLKTHYFNYYNALFSLHRLFLQVCADPEAPLSTDEWKDLKLYWGDPARVTGLVSQRLSAEGRRALAASAPPLRKEGIG